MSIFGFSESLLMPVVNLLLGTALLLSSLVARWWASIFTCTWLIGAQLAALLLDSRAYPGSAPAMSDAIVATGAACGLIISAGALAALVVRAQHQVRGVRPFRPFEYAVVFPCVLSGMTLARNAGTAHFASPALYVLATITSCMGILPLPIGGVGLWVMNRRMRREQANRTGLM